MLLFFRGQADMGDKKHTTSWHAWEHAEKINDAGIPFPCSLQRQSLKLIFIPDL